MTTKPAEQLALGDNIMVGKSKATIVAVGFTSMKKDRVRVAYQDFYTPPELHKETGFVVGDQVEMWEEN